MTESVMPDRWGLFSAFPPAELDPTPHVRPRSGRPTGLSADPLNAGDAALSLATASYGAASQLTGMTYLIDLDAGAVPRYYNETRSYNSRLQLTRFTATAGGLAPPVDLEYRYAAGQNNRRITQMKDWISGEEITYGYDSLNRLISAIATGTGSPRRATATTPAGT